MHFKLEKFAVMEMGITASAVIQQECEADIYTFSLAFFQIHVDKADAPEDLERVWGGVNIPD